MFLSNMIIVFKVFIFWFIAVVSVRKDKAGDKNRPAAPADEHT